jgi:hypothetical protein
MRTKFYIRSDTPEVTTRLAQIPGRVPRFRIWLVTSVMERNQRDLKRPRKSMPKPRILWFSIARLVR